MPEFIPPLPNFETLTTGLTDEEMRMEAVRIAVQINERSLPYNGKKDL